MTDITNTLSPESQAFLLRLTTRGTGDNRPYEAVLAEIEHKVRESAFAKSEEVDAKMDRLTEQIMATLERNEATALEALYESRREADALRVGLFPEHRVLEPQYGWDFVVHRCRECGCLVGPVESGTLPHVYGELWDLSGPEWCDAHKLAKIAGGAND